MIITNLEIIEPSVTERDVRPGNTKVLEYKIRNIGDHPLISLEVLSETIKKTGIDSSKDPIFEKTNTNYSRVVLKPMELLVNQEGIVKVEVKVPQEYNEVVKNSEGRLVRTPFRVKLIVNSLEDIKEI